MSSAVQSIPRLDAIDLVRGNFSLDLVRHALHDVGFLVITNVGKVGVEVDRVLSLSRDFFALPLARKLEISYLKSPQFRGYMEMGRELTKGRVDMREQIEFGPEEEPVPPEEKCSGKDEFLPDRLRGRNQWPPVEGFRETFLRYLDKLNWLSRLILEKAVVPSLPEGYDLASVIDLSYPHFQAKIVSCMKQRRRDHIPL